MKTKIIAISLVLVAVITASCGESGNQPAADSTQTTPVFPIASPVESLTPAPSEPFVSEMPGTSPSGFPEETQNEDTEDKYWDIRYEYEMSPIMAELVDILQPLTVPQPGVSYNVLNPDAVIPATRIQSYMQYDEFCEFVESVKTSDWNTAMAWSECTREDYESPPRTDDGFSHYDDGTIGYHVVPDNFGYYTYEGDGEYSNAWQPYGYFIPMKVDYNNDGHEDVVLLNNPGPSEAYRILCFETKNGVFELNYFFLASTPTGAPLTFGFFSYKDTTVFLSFSSRSSEGYVFSKGNFSLDHFLRLYIRIFRAGEPCELVMIEEGEVVQLSAEHYNQ